MAAVHVEAVVHRPGQPGISSRRGRGPVTPVADVSRFVTSLANAYNPVAPQPTGEPQASVSGAHKRSSAA